MLVVKRDVFLTAAEKARKALRETKGNMLSGCIRVAANKKTVLITAFSSALQIQTMMKAETDDAIDFVVNASKLLDCLVLIPGEKVMFEMHNRMLSMKCGNYVFQYPTLEVKEWWNPVSEERVLFRKKLPDMAGMVRDCFHSLPNNESSMYSSFYLEFGSENVRITAFDTKRMSIRGDRNFTPQNKFLVNGKALKTVCQMVSCPEVSLTENSLYITDTNFLARIVGSRRLYPDLYKLFPDNALRIKVNRNEFLENCNVMLQINTEMVMQKDGNQLILSVESPTGTGSNVLSIQEVLFDKMNATLKYRVNLPRLIESVSSIHEKEIELNFGGNQQPICIDGKDYIELILCYINNRSYR